MENGLWSWIKDFGRWFQGGSTTMSETTDDHPPSSRFEDVAEMFGACWDFLCGYDRQPCLSKD
ncbi:hypothetical protein COCC4DRAFT_32331 [Bipolaris maydis ATCC 48331]|uniref:Uncharacterized protein n=2 Tax=Cochliobolus heterostrophus TaxID=5016 RepID=M2U388_COCH5|nr:uncharacterized protein COCC4DRAFT_32331 [Bipolaris maydis ATCC 48331]EMD93024.1 hypothetical protein COCHEDRAFT_1020854 [Bipolaris maydis C5]ENI04588.1 hypothetical protein COCC4DRAFT_32331 [Bipolaris maydis ATCC 48331]